MDEWLAGRCVQLSIFVIGTAVSNKLWLLILESTFTRCDLSLSVLLLLYTLILPQHKALLSTTC